MKKIFIKILIILSSIIILLGLIFFTNGFNQLIKLLTNINYLWIAGAFSCIFVYWIIDGLIIQLITKSLFEKQRFRDSLKITMIGQFFNEITPFAVGGQPAQIYVMAKDGVNMGHATSILTIRSVFYQATLVFYTLVVITLKAPFFSSKVPHLLILYAISFVINVAGIMMYFMAFYNSRVVHKLFISFINILHKIKFIKNPEKIQTKLEAEIHSFTDGIVILKKNVNVMVQVFLLQVAQFTMFFSIPYFIYLSLEIGWGDFWAMVSAQSLVTIITLLIPTPGSTGGIEGISYLFYSLFFWKGIIIQVILIWRIITYYSAVIFGGLVAVFAPEKPLKK